MKEAIAKKFQLRKNYFFPYTEKISTFYLAYLILFFTIGTFAISFNLFLIINLKNNGFYKKIANISDLNLGFTPILILTLVMIAWIFLLLAPHKVHSSPKSSSCMFYISFWSFIIAIAFNTLSVFSFYKLKNFCYDLDWSLILLKIISLITLFSLIFLQIWFWSFRRKFTYMPSDYELYTSKQNKKQALKLARQALRRAKKTRKI